MTVTKVTLLWYLTRPDHVVLDIFGFWHTLINYAPVNCCRECRDEWQTTLTSRYHNRGSARSVSSILQISTPFRKLKALARFFVMKATSCAACKWRVIGGEITLALSVSDQSEGRPGKFSSTFVDVATWKTEFTVSKFRTCLDILHVRVCSMSTNSFLDREYFVRVSLKCLWTIQKLFYVLRVRSLLYEMFFNLFNLFLRRTYWYFICRANYVLVQ